MTELCLHFFCDVLAQGAVAFVPDKRVRPGSHEHPKKPIDYPVGSELVLVAPLVRLVQRQAQRRAYIQTEQVFVDGLEVSKDFLDLVDHVVHIIFSKLLNPLVCHSV